jgi:hypothetical protein
MRNQKPETCHISLEWQRRHTVAALVAKYAPILFRPVPDAKDRSVRPLGMTPPVPLYPSASDG